MVPSSGFDLTVARLDRILIPLDGSRRAERAIPLAAYIGAMLRVPVEVLTVSDKSDISFINLDQSVKRSIAQAEDFLSTWVGSIETTILTGDPAKAIVDYSDDGVTLIVMATHGGMGEMRKLTVSVAEDILKAIDSPVLLLRSDDTPANIQIAARISSLLVPLDKTKSAERSLNYCGLLAEMLRAQITLLHVGETPGSNTYLECASKSFANLDRSVTMAIRDGHMGRAVVDQADSMESPMVIICSDRTSNVSGLVSSEVTDFIVRRSRYPVLVIPRSFRNGRQ